MQKKRQLSNGVLSFLPRHSSIEIQEVKVDMCKNVSKLRVLLTSDWTATIKL